MSLQTFPGGKPGQGKMEEKPMVVTPASHRGHRAQPRAVRIQLACDYWFSTSSKCAETATWEWHRPGATCHSCDFHKQQLLRASRRREPWVAP